MSLEARRAGLALIVASVALVVWLTCLGGCKPKPDYERGLGLPDTSASRERVKMDPRCELGEVVSAPAEGTPEWVIRDILTAATGPEGEAGFDRFFKHFKGEKDEAWVRRQYWPRAREHASKYLEEGDGVVYTICRRKEQPDGGLKIFIKSHEATKSNPPITVKKNADGVWKVVFYTP